MDDVTIARAFHVVFVVAWIGGVGFVTTVVLPAMHGLKPPTERMQLFDQIERRFAWQTRISITAVGLTGFYMLYRFDVWDRFRYGAYWWLDTMVGIWLVFTLMLFVFEPFILHRWRLARSALRSEATFRRLEWLHRILLFVSLITVLGAVMGSHGVLLFQGR
jgi:uncharacterized membrane protein